MKPDYSNIEPMACKCGSIEERDEILRQLKEWGVPLSHAWDVLPSDMFVSWEYEKTLLTFTRESLVDGKTLSPSDFLSMFREVYDKWRSTEGLVHIEQAPVAAKGIVFPSYEEVEELLKDIIKFDNRLLIGPAIDRYKQRVIELNQPQP